MKEEIVLPKKYFMILLIIFLSTIISAIIFFTKIQSKHNLEILIFQNKNINGKIVKLNDLSRGMYSLTIINEGLVYETPSLPIAFEVEKYNIKIGDSLYKDSNSKSVTFFKKKNAMFEKCFKYEID